MSEGAVAGPAITQILHEGAERLIAAGIPRDEARAEVRTLLLHASGLSREALHLRATESLSPDSQTAYLALLARREQREPLAYLLGERAFYGRSFRVTPDVLIPRPETEFLVETVLAAARNIPQPRIVDIGTGSGVIAISLAAALPQARVWATDISAAALAVARENADRLGVADRIAFREGDLLAGLTAEGPFEAIAANPPYIAPAEIKTLEPEVRDWEPSLALGTHPDALHFYRRLAAEAPPLLAPDGILAVEVGMGQALEVVALWQDAGLADIDMVQDYAGIERVVFGRRVD